MTQNRSVYEAVGGAETFLRLAHAFYAGVAEDALLRPLYSEPDLEGAEERLALFLMQYFGGPQTYSQQRGHPRLRMRHFPFVIGKAERDAWFSHMSAAVDTVDIAEPQRSEMLKYFGDAATFLINKDPANA